MKIPGLSSVRGIQSHTNDAIPGYFSPIKDTDLQKLRKDLISYIDTNYAGISRSAAAEHLQMYIGLLCDNTDLASARDNKRSIRVF